MYTEKKKINFELFKTFFLLGASTFGGGYAMLALIERVVVKEKKWLEEEELLDILAVAQATPGTIAINSATYVGKKVSGKYGAILASTGVVLPSFLIITLLYPILIASFGNEKLDSIFVGIQCAVVALILNSAIKIMKNGLKDKYSVVIFISTFLLVLLTPINPLWLIVIGGFVGLILGFAKVVR